MLGAIIPEPLAMPPTTYLRSLVIERVRRELRHAIGRHDRFGGIVAPPCPPTSSCATHARARAARDPSAAARRSRPVEATMTCVGRNAEQRRRLPRGRARVALAAFAGAGVRAARVADERAHRGASARCSALTSSGAALISLVVTTDAQRCGSSNAISARSRLRGLMPACTPARRTPGTHAQAAAHGRSVQATTARSCQVRCSSGNPNMMLRFCTACPAAPLPRLSIAQIARTDAAVDVDAQLRVVRADNRRNARRPAAREHAHERAAAVGTRVRCGAPRPRRAVRRRSRRRRRAFRARSARRAA